MNERIKKLRKALDLTQQDFATRIGSVQNTITGYETGRRVPSNQVIALICKTFNVSEIWLRTGEGEMFTETPETLAEKLSKEYGLDALGCQIMVAYLKLDEQDRLAVGRLIQNIIDERTTPIPAAKITTQHSQEMTDEELHAELDRQLAAERKKAAGTSASGRGGSGTVAG